MTDRELIRGRLKTYFRMLAVHDPRLGNELVDVLDAYLDAKFKREWKGLTNEEIREVVGVTSADSDWNVTIVHKWIRAIEAKLKEKNNG